MAVHAGRPLSAWTYLLRNPRRVAALFAIQTLVTSLLVLIITPTNAFEALGTRSLEAAWTLGATPRDAFLFVAVPQARRGYVTAAVMGFAHTLGEFGVVLMVGGNIPGQTKVISIAIYEQVESLRYDDAHLLSLGLVAMLTITGVMFFRKTEKAFADVI